MSDDIDNEKRALRAEIRERRQLLSESQRESASVGIAAQLDALISAHGAQSISCYLSMMTEPGTREFLATAIARGIRVLLPITRADGLLDWAVAGSIDDTIVGAYGLDEPTGEVLGPIAVGDVDLMIIPAAAVDEAGMRLGWGRGYFDKTLGSMERTPPVYAVIYDTEFVPGVPADLHDQSVTGVVTPTRTLTLAASAR